MDTWTRMVPARYTLAAFLAFMGAFGVVWAEERSFYSPIIDVDKEHGMVIIAADGRVFAVQASEAAKPHVEKLPISGLVDLVVEVVPDKRFPIIKRWKVMSGDSTCKIFDGKTCK